MIWCSLLCVESTANNFRAMVFSVQHQAVKDHLIWRYCHTSRGVTATHMEQLTFTLTNPTSEDAIVFCVSSLPHADSAAFPYVFFGKRTVYEVSS